MGSDGLRHRPARNDRDPAAALTTSPTPATDRGPAPRPKPNKPDKPEPEQKTAPHPKSAVTPEIAPSTRLPRTPSRSFASDMEWTLQFKDPHQEAHFRSTQLARTVKYALAFEVVIFLVNTAWCLHAYRHIDADPLELRVAVGRVAVNIVSVPPLACVFVQTRRDPKAFSNGLASCRMHSIALAVNIIADNWVGSLLQGSMSEHSGVPLTLYAVAAGTLLTGFPWFRQATYTLSSLVLFVAARVFWSPHSLDVHQFVDSAVVLGLLLALSYHCDKGMRTDFLARRRLYEYCSKVVHSSPCATDEGGIQPAEFQELESFDEFSATDVTGHVEKVLQHAMRVAEHYSASEARKSLHLAATSHDLRTPLSGILGFTELMLAEHYVPRKLRVLGRLVQSSATYLLQTVDNMLQLSRRSAGEAKDAVRLASVVFDPIDVARDCVAACMSDARSRQVALSFDCSSVADTGLLLRGDEVRIKQVVIQLLCHALRCSDNGEPICLTVASQAGNAPSRSVLKISVHNAGEVPSAEEVARLLQSEGPLGPGPRLLHDRVDLSMADRLVKMMGSDGFNFEPRHGGGCTISVELEVKTVVVSDTVSRTPRHVKKWCTTESVSLLDGAASVHRAPADGNANLPLVGKRILVVDDVANLRKVAIMMLHKAGAFAKGAADGEDAVHQVSEAIDGGEPFDVVIMDLHMPKMPGDRATRAIKATHSTNAPVIIGISADSIVETSGCFREAGADGVLAKPYSAETLIRKICRRGV